MAIETLPEPSFPITTPFRPGLGFLTSTPIIAAATICLALVILVRDPGALALAARSAAARPGAAAEARERAVSAGHRRLRPRRAVAHPLWRTDLAGDRPWRSGVQHQYRACDRPRLRFLPMGRCRDDAGDGRADGDPEHPARHRRGLAVGCEPDDGANRHHHSRNSPRRAAGALGRAVGARGALRGSGDFGRLQPAEDHVAAFDAEHGCAPDRARHLRVRRRRFSPRRSCRSSAPASARRRRPGATSWPRAAPISRSNRR